MLIYLFNLMYFSSSNSRESGYVDNLFRPIFIYRIILFSAG
jgi:hypothetical protein